MTVQEEEKRVDYSTTAPHEKISEGEPPQDLIPFPPRTLRIPHTMTPYQPATLFAPPSVHLQSVNQRQSGGQMPLAGGSGGSILYLPFSVKLRLTTTGCGASSFRQTFSVFDHFSPAWSLSRSFHAMIYLISTSTPQGPLSTREILILSYRPGPSDWCAIARSSTQLIVGFDNKNMLWPFPKCSFAARLSKVVRSRPTILEL